MKPLLRSLLFRAGTSPIQFGLVAITTWLATSTIGPNNYSAVLLVTGLPLLLPFLDLGSNAPLISGIAKRGTRGNNLLLFSFALRKSGFSGLAIFVVGCLVSYNSRSDLLFGNSTSVFESPELIILAFSALFAVTTFLTPSLKVFVGLGQAHLTMVLGVATAALSCLLTLLASELHLGVDYFALISSISASITMAYAFMLVLTRLDLTLVEVCREVLNFRSKTPSSVRSNAKFMFILSIGLAAIQFSDRYIVANLLPKASLPSFVYASLIYVPLWAAISSVLITLWPHFTSLQINLEPSIVRKKVQQLWGSVVLIGVALGIVFAVTAPFVIQLVSSGLVEVNLAVIYAFSLLLIVQIAQFPIGVYLVDNAGLRFQAFFVSIAAIMCIPLSSVLVSSIGASGSVLASASLIVIFQLLPNTLRFARKQEIKSREIHDK